MGVSLWAEPIADDRYWLPSPCLFLGRQALASLIAARSPGHRNQPPPPKPGAAPSSDDSSDHTPPTSTSPLLLAQVLKLEMSRTKLFKFFKVDSLKKALGYSQDENAHLRAQAVRVSQDLK